MVEILFFQYFTKNYNGEKEDQLILLEAIACGCSDEFISNLYKRKYSNN